MQRVRVLAPVAVMLALLLLGLTIPAHAQHTTPPSYCASGIYDPDHLIYDTEMIERDIARLEAKDIRVLVGVVPSSYQPSRTPVLQDIMAECPQLMDEDGQPHPKVIGLLVEVMDDVVHSIVGENLAAFGAPPGKYGEDLQDAILQDVPDKHYDLALHEGLGLINVRTDAKGKPIVLGHRDTADVLWSIIGIGLIVLAVVGSIVWLARSVSRSVRAREDRQARQEILLGTIQANTDTAVTLHAHMHAYSADLERLTEMLTPEEARDARAMIETYSVEVTTHIDAWQSFMREVRNTPISEPLFEVYRTRMDDLAARNSTLDSEYADIVATFERINARLASLEALPEQYASILILTQAALTQAEREGWTIDPGQRALDHAQACAAQATQAHAAFAFLQAEAHWQEALATLEEAHTWSTTLEATHTSLLRRTQGYTDELALAHADIERATPLLSDLVKHYPKSLWTHVIDGDGDARKALQDVPEYIDQVTLALYRDRVRWDAAAQAMEEVERRLDEASALSHAIIDLHARAEECQAGLPALVERVQGLVDQAASKTAGTPAARTHDANRATGTQDATLDASKIAANPANNDLVDRASTLLAKATQTRCNVVAITEQLTELERLLAHTMGSLTPKDHS